MDEIHRSIAQLFTPAVGRRKNGDFPGSLRGFGGGFPAILICLTGQDVFDSPHANSLEAIYLPPILELVS